MTYERIVTTIGGKTNAAIVNCAATGGRMPKNLLIRKQSYGDNYGARTEGIDGFGRGYSVNRRSSAGRIFLRENRRRRAYSAWRDTRPDERVGRIARKHLSLQNGRPKRPRNR